MKGSAKPRSIKELVLETVKLTKGKVSLEQMTAKVKKVFPKSKWNKNHWDYYRTKIKMEGLFSYKIQANLKITQSLEKAKRKRKGIGDPILNYVREKILKDTAGNPDLKFQVNRWIFSRLQSDERKTKTPIKRELWSRRQNCMRCGENPHSLTGVELHRVNQDIGYYIDNCELLCKPCHQKHHTKTEKG